MNSNFFLIFNAEFLKFIEIFCCCFISGIIFKYYKKNNLQDNRNIVAFHQGATKVSVTIVVRFASAGAVVRVAGRVVCDAEPCQ